MENWQGFVVALPRSSKRRTEEMPGCPRGYSFLSRKLAKVKCYPRTRTAFEAAVFPDTNSAREALEGYQNAVSSVDSLEVNDWLVERLKEAKIVSVHEASMLADGCVHLLFHSCHLYED